MRLSAIVVLVLSIAAAACNQPQPASSTPEPQGLAGAAGSTTTDAEPPANVPGGPAANTAPGTGAAPGSAATMAAAPGQAVPASGSALTAGGAAAADAPVFREVTLPAGTELSLVLDTPVASDTSRLEAPVRAHLAKPLSIDGVTALPAGSQVEGSVTEVERSGKVKGLAHLAFRFNELSRSDDSERYRIETSAVSRTARATKGKDATKVGGGALGGAIVGGIIGGKKGAAIGTAAGAGAGGAVVMSTRGEEVRLGRGATVSVRLSQPLTIRVPRS